MNKKILIKKNALSMEIALLVDDELTQYYVDSVLETNWQNRIVIGQVKEVVKNLKAAFVDYGVDKNGMLHFKQIPDELLKRVQQGYLLPVQIIKQNIGDKGHKLTAKLNITGKYLVCLPFEAGVHISKKIHDATIRNQIKEALEAKLETSYGFIVRTHAGDAPIEKILEDARDLTRKTDALLKSSGYLTKGSVLYEEPRAIYQMLIEELIKRKEIEIICSDEDTFSEVQSIVSDYGDIEKVTVRCYEDKQNLFSDYGVSKKIEQITKRTVWLKNGGNIVIDYTEAMTVMDVNSAKAILTKNPEKATLELNKQAVKEAILQILRRNLAGMIIIDLVEMKDPSHKQEVYEYAKHILELFGDTITKVYPLTELGLLQFSRTKKYECVIHKLQDECLTCHKPYGENSFLMELIKLEKQLSGITLQETRQAVYLEVHPDFYEEMIKQKVVSILEAHYPVKINMKKTTVWQEKSILCQFYER